MNQLHKEHILLRGKRLAEDDIGLRKKRNMNFLAKLARI